MNEKLLEELFNINKIKIEELENKFNGNNDKTVSSFAYNFVNCTLAEAQAFNPTYTEYRHITDARKSGETAGNGTGLPSFYNISTATWVDFMGNPIQV